MSVFSVTGYWGDDHTPIDNYLVTDGDTTPEGYSDDQIFFYGLSEAEIKHAIASKQAIHDFVITTYKEV